MVYHNTALPCQINPLLLGYDDVSKIMSIHNQMSYDLYLSTRLFAVGDKWNTNVPYVANIKINNAAKGTESYADSVIHEITEEMHCLMQKKLKN